jgi:hypothetical protein
MDAACVAAVVAVPVALSLLTGITTVLYRSDEGLGGRITTFLNRLYSSSDLYRK